MIRAMWEALDRLFSGRFMPHGHCYLWTPSMVWLQVISNLLIAAAYMSISLTLAYILKKIRDIPFSWMYGAFGVFIISCGFTHILDVVTIWDPIYWFDGGLRGITAIASVGTAVLLIPLVPKAIGLADAAQLAHQRGQKLESTFEELAAAHAKMTELEKLKTEFFANVSHELRTPLALILGPAEKLLGSKNLEPSQIRDLEVLTRNARTLLKHVNDLLDVAKLEAGKMDVQLAAGDVALLVRLVASHFESLANERKTTLEVLGPDTLPAEIDAEKLQRALVNIVANAFKFTPEGGTVKCTFSERQGNVRIAVADSGPGVPENLRATIFERFAQAEGGTTRRFGGTGLGLAITKDFVALHGGTVSVSDSDEGGALFILEFPRRLPTSSEMQRARTSTAPASIPSIAPQVIDELRVLGDLPQAKGETGNPVVLVVEDNREMNAFISDALSTRYKVERAFDGLEGLRKARALKPDLVVTDVMMPTMGGDELVTELRKQSELDAVPIVVLTAKADDDLRVKLLRQGAEDYVQKPFRVEELQARAANLIAMKRTRDYLRREVSSQAEDLEALAKDLGRRKRELESALETIRVARDHAERANQLKSEFLAMVSHELRTPLTSMQLLIDGLSSRSEFAEGEKKMVDRLSLSTNRLTDLVDSLLQYARLQSGRMKVNIARTDLIELMKSVVADAKAQIETKSLTFSLASPEVATIVTDEKLLRLVMTNLVSNAVKFTAQGSVDVTLAAASDGFMLRVKDSGRGIPADELSRIFEPFRHLEPVRQKHSRGVGLGLSLVREIIDNLGGTIEVRSEVGKGSVFEVFLPLSIAPTTTPS